MKKLILISTILLLPSIFNLLPFGDCWSGVSFAQVYAPPEGINYQAVARDTTGKPLSSSSNLVVKFTIWPDNSGTGTSIFTEIHSPVNTNRYGLFSLVIGSVNTSDFQNIIWVLDDKFLQVEIATVGGSSYTSMGLTQLMSVPYALHSKTSLYSYGNWSISGNNITSPTDFIGTTNSADLLIKTDSIERMRVTSIGNIGIGTATPLSKLDVSGGIAIGTNYSGTTAAPANGAIIEGNVGIGTSTPDPAAILDLSGQIKITGGNPGTNKVLTSDAAGLATWAIPDTGSVTSFSADSLAPLFTTTVSNATMAPALSFTLSDAAAYTVWGNNTGASTTPAYFVPTLASPLFQNQGTASTVLHGNATGNPSWGQIVNADIANTSINLATKVSGMLPIVNGGTNTNTIGSAGSIPYSNTTGTAYGFSAVGTSGQVLTSGGTGAPTWTTPTTGTVTSVTGIAPILSTGGTTPAISVATNSQTSPGVVTAGGSNFNTVWKTDGTGAPGWRNDSSASYIAGTGLSLSGNTFNSVWTQSGNDIYNNNTSNIGIGTTTPSTQLHTTGGVRFQTLSGTGSRFVLTDANGNLTPGLSPGAGGTLNYVAKFTPDGITLGNSGIFDNGTNVGIGTVTPVSKFDVKNNAAAGGTGSFENFNAANTASTLIGRTNGSGNAIFAMNTGLWRAATFSINNAANIFDALYSETNGSGSAIYGRNTSTGKAGTFEILNAASAADALYVTTNGLGNAFYSASTGTGRAGYFQISNTSSIADALFISSNGINSKALQIWHIGSTGTATDYGAYITATGVRAAGSINVGGYFTASGATNNYAGIFDQGNVGIGTTTPTSQLQTIATGAKTADYSGAKFTNNATSASGTFIKAALELKSNGSWLGTNAANIGLYVSSVSGGTTNYDAIFNGGGNVGIGTMTPTSPLTIQTRAGTELEFVSTGSNADISANAQFNIGSTSSLHLLTGGSTRLSVLNNGNVGIGTTAPATNARLAINDGHLQSLQTTAPTLGATIGFVSGSQNLSNATDVAGNVSIIPVAATSGSVTILFNKSYSIAPIVILSPTNGNAANDITKVWVTTTTTSFTINFTATFDISAHTFSYHVIETQ